MRLSQVNVWLGFGRDDTFRQTAAVVFDQAVLPLEKVGDGLWLDSDLDTAKAGQQKVHFAHEAGLAALALAARLHGDADFTAFTFEQAPFPGQLIGGNEALRDTVKTLTSHGELGIFAEGLFLVGKEVGAG